MNDSRLSLQRNYLPWNTNKKNTFVSLYCKIYLSFSGGSISNLYAVNVARHKKFPEIKTKGMGAVTKTPCLFTSEKVRQLHVHLFFIVASET